MSAKGLLGKLKGENFVSDAMLLPLGGRDMVLGMQWLSTLGDIKCNLKELRMEFMYNGSKVALRSTPKPTTQWIEGKKQLQMLESTPLCCVCIQTLG